MGNDESKAAARLPRRNKVLVGVEMISLPVLCPRCGQSSQTKFPVPVVVIALTRWNNMALYCECHDSNWTATQEEIQTLRAYLGQEWLDAHRDLAQHPAV
jgi:hypothetical protein